MKLTAAELAHVRSEGLFITEKCDGCGALLNQTCRYTITGKPETYCSPLCRDAVFFGDRLDAEKRARPGKCVNCGGSLSGKKRGALYCDDACRKACGRKIPVSRDAATPKIPDTDVIESVTYNSENRGSGQSLAPPVSTSQRGTERATTTEKVSESGLSSSPQCELRTGRLRPMEQQTFDFVSQSDLRPTRPTSTLRRKPRNRGREDARDQAVVGNTLRRSDRPDALTLFP